MTVAALAPIISRLVPGRPPQVLFLILGGIVIGPHALGFAASGAIELLAALGTLLPILRDQNMLTGTFGRFIFAAGAAGELFPILAISLFLGAYKTWWEALIIASIAGLAFVLAWLTRLLSGTRVAAIIGENKHATSQSTLRITVVLLVGLLLITQKFGVEAALGAFFAGMVLRRTSTTDDNSEFEEKLDAVGYGFFIPVFFVSSGMALDLQSIVENPLRLLVFFVLLLAVRGAPALLVYRKSLALRERFEMVFLTATPLPLLVALSEIGIDSGVMLPQNAAALVGAGVLSVAIFPLVATRIHRPSDPTAARQGAAEAPTKPPPTGPTAPA